MFSRGKSEPSPSSEVPSTLVDTSAEAPSTKGRPTPSRKEAEAARKAALKPATDKKAARAREREDRMKQRDAMMRGDEKALALRDRGPVRRIARDYVDSRRNAGELFLIGAFIVLVLSFIAVPRIQATAFLVWIGLVFLIAIDSIFLMRGLRRRLKAEVPDESTKGLTFYATMRALQIRRLRVPSPQVKPGR